MLVDIQPHPKQRYFTMAQSSIRIRETDLGQVFNEKYMPRVLPIPSPSLGHYPALRSNDLTDLQGSNHLSSMPIDYPLRRPSLSLSGQPLFEKPKILLSWPVQVRYALLATGCSSSQTAFLGTRPSADFG